METWDHDALDLTEVGAKTADELFDFLTTDLEFPDEDMEKLRECNVDGSSFQNLSREDLATLFPGPSNFVMSSKLYRVIQRAKVTSEESSSTQAILRDLSNVEHVAVQHTKHLTTGPGMKRRSAESDPPSIKQAKCTSSTPGVFCLPVFSPDLRRCIKSDSFYTSALRNKLIKEACTALRGFYWQRNLPATNESKRMLAKMLLDLAPKSLGDTRTSKESGREAGLYGQIIRWFQNHSYLDRKSCGEVKSPTLRVRPTNATTEQSEDDTAVEHHLRALERECGRKTISDKDKIIRLLSLTHAARQREMGKLSASLRIPETIKKFGVLQTASYLATEMFLVFGSHFEGFSEVKKKLCSIFDCWTRRFIPAVVDYSKELGMPPPENDGTNCLAMYCLSTLVEKLKGRNTKKSIEERKNSIIVFSQSAEEGMQKVRGNTHAFLLCTGTPEDIVSCVVVCGGKVITSHIGKTVLSCLVILLAVHHVYNLEFNPTVKEVMEFLQEKVLGIQLPASRKTSKAYDQLYRAIGCLERKREEEEKASDCDAESDEDATQVNCEY